MSELEAARQPEQHLGDAIRAHEQAEAEVARLRAAHQAELAVWIESGGKPLQPPEPIELAEARDKAKALEPLADAAKDRLPAVQAIIQQASERVAHASRLCEDAAYWGIIALG